MALIITLILLSVTLIMAVAFLALARRERGAVTTTTDTTVARLATEAALAAAQAQMAANIFTSTNQGAYDYHVFVSTNYISPAGYDPKAGPAGNGVSATNVNYDYTADNSVYSVADIEQNIANLWLLPRAPVYVFNPAKNATDFRFYLDLNRNGQFEANGIVSNVENTLTGPVTNGVISEVGDPEWIGVLERPDQPHGPNNHFLARYAFLAQPIGNSLDLNYIHNNARYSPTAADDGFLRNQGVGSWELNLAAFLADLNTNEWFANAGSSYYDYEPFYATGPISQFRAFDDSLAVLNYRYGGGYVNLAKLVTVFPNSAVLQNQAFDIYPFGLPMTTTATPVYANNNNNYWAGSDNTNRFFSLPSDLFGVNGFLGNFPAHLAAAGNGPATYDRYTFYRLLDQLGTDSKADDSKLNVNYSNAVVGCNAYGMVTNVSIVPGAETNLVPWSATNFFNAAANSMLLYYTSNWLASDTSAGHFYYTNAFAGLSNAFGLTNIPVYVNGQFVYSPAVNRLLQLAANIYDAGNTNTYPTVFRPLFSHTGTNIFVTGYTQVASVTDTSDPQLSQPFDPAYFSTVVGQPNVAVNLYGVPWIIGVKKGLPGFNQLSMVNSAFFQRRLEVARNTLSGPIVATNQLVTIAVTNSLGISFWNSYSNDYVAGGNLGVYVNSAVQMAFTNSDWSAPYINTFASSNYYSFQPINNRWPGSKWGANDSGQPAANSFFNIYTNNVLIPNEAYNFSSSPKKFTFDLQSAWDPTLSPLPQIGLLTTNLLQAYILDGNHVIDYVQLRGPVDGTNLTAALQDPNNGNPPVGGTPTYYMWLNNLFDKNGENWGIKDQLTYSSQDITPKTPGGVWNNPPQSIPGLSQKAAAQKFFNAILGPSPQFSYGAPPVTYHITQLTNQAPFSPTRTVFVPYLYQVNDPLVHYTTGDLDCRKSGIWAGNNVVLANGAWAQDNGVVSETFPIVPSVSSPGIANGYSRYQPWGQPASSALATSSDYDFSNPYNLTYKDPGVWGPDLWDFPTNRFPAVGWLGRVHRGTPWQTVYLKASDILQDAKLNTSGTSVGPLTWSQWTGNGLYFDSSNSAPVQDRALFDLFTTRFNDNAVHGSLSVNQTHLAAWSALFGGMVVPNNLSGGYAVISPSGPAGEFTDPYLGALVTNINFTRSTFTNADGLVGVFERPGDILKSPLLTEKSPFLAGGVNDELYEWLPQQTLGLLHADTAPRYVVYCYGQTLKPAPNSLVTAAGQFFGLCTNYQITAENAARAVIRVDRHISVNNAGAPIGTNYTTVLESFNPLPPN